MLQKVWNSIRQSATAPDFIDLLDPNRKLEPEDVVKKQNKYVCTQLAISIIDDLIKRSTEIWRCEMIDTDFYICQKLEWLKPDRNRISKFNTYKYYEKDHKI